MDEDKVYYCEHCIAYLRSRGEHLYVDTSDIGKDEDDNNIPCEWCEDDICETYACRW